MLAAKRGLSVGYKALNSINGVEFTNREVDIIACIVSGRTSHKDISFLISITPKAIEANKSNINRKIRQVTNLNIRDFVERSDKYFLLQVHYSYLSYRSEFEKILVQIAASSSSEEPVSVAVYFGQNQDVEHLVSEGDKGKILKDLRLLGFNAASYNVNEIKLANGTKPHHLDADYVILILSTDMLDDMQSEHDLKKTKAYKIIEYLASENKNNPTLLLLNEVVQIDLLDKLDISLKNSCSLNYISFEENYYCAFFDLLDKLKVTSNTKVKILIEEFKKKSDAPEHSHNMLLPGDLNQIGDKLSNVLVSHSSKSIALMGLMTACCVIVIIYYLGHKSSAHDIPKYSAIRSDLITPANSSILERPEIIKKIDEHLKGSSGIQTIAITGIIGIGGAGKTTMARWYAKSISNSEASIIWELNAESRDTLMNSWRDLAYILAETPKLKKDLDYIQQISDSAMQEKLLLNFVKARLHERQNWVLIYDNMESFSKMSHLFPQHHNQWGSGKIIITTRNENLLDTSYIRPEDVIRVDELTDNEKLTLFSKIIYNSTPEELDISTKDKTISFLRDIPPFPLDISVAAYSIKNSHVTFDEYLDNIKNYNDSYNKMQLTFLKEVTDYSKTRYGIISSTVEKLISINPNFKELFLFMCSLDSQNISYDLLRHYNNSMIIDDLVHHLRKNGLLLKQSFDKSTEWGKRSVSIHRSTQEIGEVFLLNSLSKEERENFVKNMTVAISDYYKDRAKNKDRKSVITLIPHVKSALKVLEKDIDLPKKFKHHYEADLYAVLGYAKYKWARNLVQARPYFEEALKKNEDNHLPPKVLATLLKDLANVSAFTANSEDAINYSNKSIEICKSIPGSEMIVAEDLLAIGASYRKIGDFENSKSYLNRALNVIPKDQYTEHKDLIAEMYTQLGNLYISHHLHKKEADVADEYYIKALKILDGFEMYKKNATAIPDNISCSLARQQWKYSEIFAFHYLDNATSVEWLNEAEHMMDNKCPEDMYLRGRIAGTRGEVLLRQGDLNGAEKKLTESINLIGSTLGPRSTWLQNVLRAETEIRLGHFAEAYEDCLYVFKLDNIETDSLHESRYVATLYHAALAQYRLGNHKLSSEHFAEFFKRAKAFCKIFLDKEAYDSLVADGAFADKQYDEKTVSNDLKACLRQVLDIFTAIHGLEHPFVKDYIARNL